ncbi:penicillin-binding transpeptidase domain-containing protein [Streptococcus sp. NLN64]|uniref:penicillin-binding transpeptidase domain-containing protein n=1 Tax=Streptococcus sp. NLN64 TaxID=2822799 RepID=UPI0018C9790F|nr:penicillin-binding transpeptidase domain-containing protein [Streptococcus sp. NLN64]MBG9366807.1 penicillin-binding protein 2 [Streptococcus sp. NLN64]
MRKKNRIEQQTIPTRLYFILGLVFSLFLILAVRLAYMQVFNQAFYLAKMATASQKIIKGSSVRGQIYDAQGKPLVENESKQVVSYTRSNQDTAESLKERAKEILQLVDVNDEDLSQRQLADYYLADPSVYKEVVDQLPKDQKIDRDGNALPEKTIYNNAVETVQLKQEELSPEDKKVALLFNQLNAIPNFGTGNLRTEDLSPEQVALIASSSQEIPGISISTSWERKVLETPLSSIVGSVSNEQTGIPAEEVEEYLKKGYSLNDRVGTSYLEKEYEEALQGKRSEKEVYLDKDGNLEKVVTTTEGEKGKNLKLTVDLDFQQGVEDILKNALQSEINKGNALETEGAYAVVLRPEDGSVLAMAGVKQDIEKHELSSDSLGTITNVFVPGSVVKPATLTAGWQTGALSGNEILADQTVLGINSWFTEGSVRDISAVQALEYSSNTYMVQVALRILGSPIGAALIDDSASVKAAMEKMRTAFGQYGMGVKTEIDLPNESVGFLPTEFTVGDYMNNAFGQFDNYTPMQLAQFAATLANGGSRIQPHIVAGIHDNDENGGLGQEIEKKTGRVLNQVNISQEDMSLLQEGMNQVVYGTSSFTTGRTVGEGASVAIAAKTGTAETFVSDGKVRSVNTNVVAYAPTSNPEIAVAVVFPHNTDLLSTVSHSITKDIVNLYYSKN